jgi:hypothetical protein
MLARFVMALALLAPPAAHAGAMCSLPAAPDARFEEVRLVAEGVYLVVEVWVQGEADVPWARSVLDALAATGHGGVLVVPYREDPLPAVIELVDSVGGGPHEVALVLARSQVPRDALARPRPMRRIVKRYESTAPVKVAIAPLGSRGPEAIMGKVGFRTMVDTEAASSAQPRLAGHLEGQARINVVLPPGAYGHGPCGADPAVAGFTPAIADRTARALLKSGVDAKTTPTVRLALHPSGSKDDASVLTRWLEEVVLPSGAMVATASEVRSRALVDFRRSPAKIERNRTVPGRLVTEDDLVAAAIALADLDVLPRELPGELTPTEALLGFATLLAEGAVDGTVRLKPLSGPASSAPGGDKAPQAVNRDALVATTKQLLAALPPELPTGLPVDGKLLTTDRYLTALASAVRGEDPVMARPIAHPDPHARGRGWGLSE